MPRRFYCGIDPGFDGAIALLNSSGSLAYVWDMPTTRQEKGKNAGRDRTRELDLGSLRDILRGVRSRPGVLVGLENPTTRPGEGSERAARFGRQLGILETMLYMLGFNYRRLAPNLWTGRLGVPGKQANDEAIQIRDRLFRQEYPGHRDLVRGPRGGIKDGRLDAFLIAHYLRQKTEPRRGANLLERTGRRAPPTLLPLNYYATGRFRAENPSKCILLAGLEDTPEYADLVRRHPEVETPQ
jgi:hypothetical protein